MESERYYTSRDLMRMVNDRETIPHQFIINEFTRFVRSCCFDIIIREHEKGKCVYRRANDEERQRIRQDSIQRLQRLGL